jgi:membrane complex biogenesis BtpA family protein
MKKMVSISAGKTDAIQAIFSRKKVVIGVIHCDPFPGTPKYRGKTIGDIIERALRDADNYVSGGVHGLIIENHGDIPFSKPEDIGPETAALMAVITEKVRTRFNVPLGINVLANAAIPALATALAGGADFIRVNQWANAYIANEGFIEGAAAKALRYRSQLRAEHIKVFADSHVKHGSHAIVADRSIQELTRDVDFFEADAVIATGQRTGDSATLSEIDEIRSATELPLLVGSGVTPDNVEQILSRTQGVIVASALKVDGVWWNEVELARVKHFMAAAASVLEGE